MLQRHVVEQRRHVVGAPDERQRRVAVDVSGSASGLGKLAVARELEPARERSRPTSSGVCAVGAAARDSALESACVVARASRRSSARAPLVAAVDQLVVRLVVSTTSGSGSRRRRTRCRLTSASAVGVGRQTRHVGTSKCMICKRLERDLGERAPARRRAA